MIMDELLEFADATALSTAGTGLAAVGDVIDLGATPQDLGNGRQMYLVIQVDTAVTSAGSATVSFQLVSDGTSTLAANGTETLHYASAAIGKADLVAGYEIVVAVPLEGSIAYERYLGIFHLPGTATLTAGAVNAYIVKDSAQWVSLPDAI